jgi:hypothetical protein
MAIIYEREHIITNTKLLSEGIKPDAFSQM